MEDDIATRTPYSYASGVLLKSNMPATIAETVFITNDDEARLLANGERQGQIAAALRIGLARYLSLSPSHPDSGGGEAVGRLATLQVIKLLLQHPLMHTCTRLLAQALTSLCS